MGPTQTDAVTAALHTVLTDHGWYVTNNPARLRAMLSDVLGPGASDARGLVDAVVISAEEGVPTELRNADDSSLDAVSSRAQVRLMDWGLAPDTAHWAVAAWRGALPSATRPADPAPVSHTPNGPPPAADTTLPEPWPVVTPQIPHGVRTELPEGAVPVRPPRRKLLLLGAAAVAVLLVLGTVAWVVLGRDDAKQEFTLGGKPVKNAEVVLAATESILGGIVERRNGVKLPDTRCFFSVPADSAAAKRADVAQSVYCGPVLFVDGSPSSPFLEFPLKVTPDGDGVTLAAPDSPTSPDPSPVPSGRALVRPDGRAPADATALSAPAPPPAAGTELFTTTEIGGGTEELELGVMAANTGGVGFKSISRIDRYGHGDNARIAPVGGQLIAFQLEDAWCEADKCTPWTRLGLKVTVGSSVRTLPVPKSEDEYFVVAVPQDADAQLSMAIDGYPQTLSLLTGKPGPKNIAILGMDGTYTEVGKTFDIIRTTSIPIRYDGEATAATRHPLSVTVPDAYLFFFASTGARPSSPQNAFLYVENDMRFKSGSTKVFTLPFDVLRFRAADGKIYRAKDIDPRANITYAVFEVPAGTRAGTFLIGGARSDRSLEGTPYRDTYSGAQVAIKF